MLIDLRVAPRPSFQTIPLTAMALSLSGERMLSVVEAMEYTLLTFKSGGGVEEDREQLGNMILLVITISHQLIHVGKVELTYLCQWRIRLRCVLGTLLDYMLQLVEWTTV